MRIGTTISGFLDPLCAIYCVWYPTLWCTYTPILCSDPFNSSCRAVVALSNSHIIYRLRRAGESWSVMHPRVTRLADGAVQLIGLTAVTSKASIMPYRGISYVENVSSLVGLISHWMVVRGNEEEGR